MGFDVLDILAIMDSIYNLGDCQNNISTFLALAHAKI